MLQGIIKRINIYKNMSFITFIKMYLLHWRDAITLEEKVECMEQLVKDICFSWRFVIEKPAGISLNVTRHNGILNAV